MPGSHSTASSRPASRPASLFKAKRASADDDNGRRRSRSDDDDDDASDSSSGAGDAGDAGDAHDAHDADSDEVPVEALVEHLLAARRALGTINQVLRGSALAAEARELYTGAAAAAAQTQFLRQGMREQVAVLQQMRRGMSRAYDAGRRDFRALIRALDAANGQLEHTMEALRATTVAAAFRPAGEAPRSLLDFVDEAGVDALRDAIKQSIAELQTSFDGDLLRFDTDLRALNKAMAAAPPPPPPLPAGDDASAPPGVPQLLASLTRRSHVMAEDLASLTRHFDLCVTAVRTTDGGPALARYRASNSNKNNDNNNNNNNNGSSSNSSSSHHENPVSISGVMAKQEAAAVAADGAGEEGDLEPLSARERAEMIQVVLQDAAEVDEVVADIGADLHEAEAEWAAVRAHAEQAAAAQAATAAAFQVLEDMGTRLRSYAAAEAEFAARWAHERAVVGERLAELEELRAFYEGYAHAYDTLILEAERRRTVEARIQTVWRKARDAVERLVDADRAERASFRQEVGDFLPTDLWLDMDRPPRGAELFAPPPVPHVDETGAGGSSTRTVVER